jgi:hypothetical protein
MAIHNHLVDNATVKQHIVKAIDRNVYANGDLCFTNKIGFLLQQ